MQSSSTQRILPERSRKVAVCRLEVGRSQWQWVGFEMLKQGKRFECMQTGKSSAIEAMSPLKEPSAPKVAAPPEVSTPVIGRQLEFTEGPEVGSNAGSTELVESDEAAIAGTEKENQYGMRKKRAPPQIFEPTLYLKKSKSISKANVDKGGERRQYKKSGLYSKDPVKAAVAREKMNVTGKAEKEHLGNSGKCSSRKLQ